MKTMISTFFIVMLSMTNLFALDNIVLDDFESGAVSFTDLVSGNPPAHFDFAVVDNPYKTGINTSNKVWEWKRYDAETENKIWAGFYATLKNEIPAGYHRIEVKYLRKNATSQLKIKCEGAINKEISAVTPASKTNEWETMVFDLTANGVLNIVKFGMFPDFYEPINPTSIVYIDDIKVIYDPTVEPPPAPTSLILFDNSADNRFFDNSWSTKTAPSTLVQEHWQATSTEPGDKLPVVTTPVKDGANALKIQWKSAEGGSWMALVASIGWQVFNLNEMKYLKFWVNSPVALAKTALPKFYFEAHSGTPKITGKLPLENYLPDGLAANTWTEVTILLTDVWAADPAFVAKNLVKGVFFEQNAADNVEHTLYFDEFKFEADAPPVITSLTLFANSASDRFHDQSWSTKTAPSTLVQEHWQAAGLPDGDKLPAVTSPVKAGANSLKLQWKSAEGGAWMALVAAVDWVSFDLTSMKTLKFYINSPVALAKTAMPKFFLESHSGNPNKTGKLMLANYLAADLAANTWTEVNIPLSDLWAADEAFTAKGVVKGIFFEQNLADNVEHTLYMDEFSFETTEAPPVITELILFANSASDRFHDQSWSTKTAPSTLVQEHWQAAGLPDGDKLPVVTSPVKAGANALKLQWKSADGGAWMALVAAVDWLSFDLTSMKTLKFWINSPVALAKSAMPKFFLESHSGNPNKTGKLMLADYLAADLVANTWTEVNILLSDLWAADEAFTAKGVVKGIFFEQNLADNVEHTLYLDEFSFETTEAPPVITELILFANSASDRFHDQSWSTKTAPSTLVQEHWQAAGLPDGDKLPVVTSPVKAGANALKLQWKSADGGAWMALVAAIDWKSFDLTTMKTLKFWVYSPVALAKTAMPKFFLESHSGNPNKTGKLLLSNYLAADLAASTWTEVSIPLRDLWAADATFTAKNVVKGIFFEQNTADNVEHTLYLDEFKFVSTSTGLNIQLSAKTIKVYYHNGEIHVTNYSGYVRVFDLVGRKVAEGAALNGKLGVNLKTGIYIVNTAEGNAKIVLQ